MTLTWNQGDIHANGINIHYYRTGGNKPQVVLNHGAMDDGLCWTRVAKALEDDYDVMMLDARGHGHSDNGQGDYSSRSRAEDLAGVIRALGLDRPVIGGHSMGAETALTMAGLYPELTRGVFLEDPPIFLPDQPIFGGDLTGKGKDPFKYMMVFMRFIRMMPLPVGVSIGRRMFTGYHEDEILPWVNSKRSLSKDLLASLFTILDLSGGIPIELLSSIDSPILLIMGDREAGAIVSQEVAEAVKAAARDVRLCHLSGASHDIRRTRFEAYIQALRKFLSEIYT
ncbi:MAG TPA: alpha/beta hydrolase [Brevefilum sp.]|nr:alpha/beta hydrolase [Brevefilum sp.]HOR19851.1 alpha/beta hydrolase [Brevefilum sp.]HPL69258.1 alpha/beta hydrolase [Brevefilum sp.]